MGRAARIEQAVEQLVALRLGQLGRVRRQLRRDMGVSVPKRRAAALLGVSVPALERWIRAGRLPVVRRPGSSREEIDSDALVDLATEVTRLREAGRSRGVLAEAFRRLEAEGKARPRLPGEPGWFPDHTEERRVEFARTTPAERIAEAIELSELATSLASRR
jgi:hypothetical protein